MRAPACIIIIDDARYRLTGVYSRREECHGRAGSRFITVLLLFKYAADTTLAGIFDDDFDCRAGITGPPRCLSRHVPPRQRQAHYRHRKFYDAVAIVSA